MAVLLTKVPEQSEMKIAAFEKNATTGKFDFAVEILGVGDGTGAMAENLDKVFGLVRGDGVLHEGEDGDVGRGLVGAQRNRLCGDWPDAGGCDWGD